MGGVTLAPVEGEENAYTYTDANGAVVTVRPQDSSTETTTTTWVITLTEKKDTVEGTGEVEIPDVEPPLADLPPAEGGESGSLSVKEVLDKVDGDTFDGEAATITKDADGNTTKIVSGSKTYEFTYTPGEAITVKDLSIADIFALLPQGGDSPYTMGEDGIYFNGHKVAFDEATGVYTPVTVTMTMTDTQAGKEDHVTQGGQEATPPDDAVTEANTEKEAAIQAVVNALHADKVTGITADSVKAQLDKDTDGNGVWTVTVTATVDGKEKTFTYTVTSSSTTEEEKWNATKVEEKDIENLVDGSGSTTTTTGNAYVSGETIVWTESVADQEVTLKDGKVDITVGSQFDGANVESVKQNGDGTTTVVTKTTNDKGEAVTKTYTFHYNQEVTQAEKDKLLGAGQAGDFTDLKKITWDVSVTTESTKTEEKNEAIFVGNGLTQSNGKYHYQDGGKDIVFDNGSTKTETVTSADGTTTTTVYTIEEQEVPLAKLTAEEIAGILGENYTDVQVKDGVITATHNGKTVTVNAAQTYKTLTVKKEVSTSKNDNLAFTDNNKEEAQNRLIQAIKDTVSNAKPNETVYVTVEGKEYALSIVDGKLVGLVDGSVDVKITESELIQWIEDNTAVNFEAMNKEELVKYLEATKENSSAPNYQLDHLDLLIDGKLKVDGEEVDCVVIPDDLEVKVSDSADSLVNGTGDIKDVNLKDYVSLDPASGRNEYKREEGQDHTLGDEKYQFYNVKGTVAYGFVDSYGKKADAMNKAEAIGGVVVKIDGRFRVYQHTASLDAYGYLGGESNGCAWQNYQSSWENLLKPGQKEYDKNSGQWVSSGWHGYQQWQVRGYDLMLGNLTLLPDGKVTASGENTYSYSAQLTTKSSSTQDNAASGTSLVVNGLTSGTSTTVDGEGGSALSGSYQITETKAEKDLKEEDGAWKYGGSGSSAYDTYQTWTQGSGSGSATFDQYNAGAKLNYTYTYEVPGAPDIVIDSRNVQAVRNVDVLLENTTVTTRPGNPIVDTETTPAPVTPTPTPTPTPEEDDDDPTPPVIVEEEDVPLAEDPVLPDVEIPDEEVPLVEAPDEEIPDVEVPDEEVPLTELPDEEVPLADVPQTNDSFLLEALALLSSGASGLWLSLNKKRKS